MKTVLAIDVSNMAYRALYSTGSLTHGGDPTGVLYGIFRDVLDMQELFVADIVAWCFDGGRDKREAIFPEYKLNRKTNQYDAEGKKARRELRKQLYRLRMGLLNELGFRNVLWQDGYEADDVIAWLCEHFSHDIVIASTDQDLYQCLVSERITMFNPITKKATTKESFERKYGIDAALWAHVKAIAGCTSDGIPGIEGIGEKTAIKFLTGEPVTEKKVKDLAAGNDLVTRNQKLTELPMEGCGPFELHDDDVTPRSWDKVMEFLGMKSLIGKR